MVVQEVDTIIVGGGVAGLACARTLHDGGYNNFVVISPEWRGSIPEYGPERINFGAYYILSTYTHVAPFVERRRRIPFKSIVWRTDARTYSFFDIRHVPHLIPLVRYVLLLRSFERHHAAMKERALEVSPSCAIAEDAFLSRLYKQPASAFIAEYGLQYWSTYFFQHVSRALGFVPVTDVTAFLLCRGMQTLVQRMYSFDYYPERLYAPFEDRRRRDAVIRVWREDGVWHVQTRNGETVSGKNIVLATPAHVAKELLGFTDTLSAASSAVMRQVKGEPTKALRLARNQYYVTDAGAVLVISREEDGTFLVYSQSGTESLDVYFSSYQVLTKRVWDPAFFLGPHLLPEERGNNCYVVGGHNAPFIEDAFVSGEYAGHAILGTYQ